MLIRHEHGFKIRNKDDAKKFLNYCVQGDGYSVHKINKTHCFFIYRDQETKKVWITEKLGNLQDIFNPEIQIPDEKMVDYIWKMRKYINQKWFNN
jgi:hypothetical protein